MIEDKKMEDAKYVQNLIKKLEENGGKIIELNKELYVYQNKYPKITETAYSNILVIRPPNVTNSKEELES